MTDFEDVGLQTSNTSQATSFSRRQKRSSLVTSIYVHGDADEVIKHVDRKGISVGTVSVASFLFFILVLAASLIGISVQSAISSSKMQDQCAEDLRSKLLNLTNTSNSLLIDVSTYSIDLFVETVFSIITDNILSAVQTYVENAEFAVTQMAFSWTKGHLDGFDITKSYDILWDFQQLFPQVVSFSITDSTQGNFLTLTNLDDGSYEVDIRNTTGSRCSICQPGALGTDKYYYLLSYPYQMAGFKLIKHKRYDPRVRDWYLAAVAGNGSGCHAQLALLSIPVRCRGIRSGQVSAPAF
jgi:hypothetical protein